MIEVLAKLAAVGVLVILALSSCTMPIESKDMASVAKAMAENNASACLKTGASGYGGGAVGLPGIAGGGGQVGLTFCRSNEPGSEIVVTEAEMRIKHGAVSDPKMAARVDQLEMTIQVIIDAIRELVSRGPTVRVD